MTAATDVGTVVVFVVCRGPGDRHHLRTVREWVATDGYARDSIIDGVQLEPGVALITKPFSFASLTRKVREALDA